MAKTCRVDRINHGLPPLKNSRDAGTALQSRQFQNIVLYRDGSGSGLLTLTKTLRYSYVDIDALITKRLQAFGQIP
jgi:hypothetical protein